MNASFRGAVAQVQRASYEKLSHKQTVTRLYRRALKVADSWAIDRELFCRQGAEIRAQFDAFKHLSPEDGAVKRQIREAQEQLHAHAHPDMYVVPYMPGGSKFMRNPPPPLGVVFEGDIPDEANVASQDVHSVQVPMSAEPEGMKTVLIDIYKKSSE
mmetsp:Transcript_28674/g.67721  ORF Transcript_28674/g.67721 Transcript_28674/m.67721 type:complete len:157 (-) Transcript_28674:26-496(-)